MTNSPLGQFYNTILVVPGSETTGIDEVGNPVLVPGVEIEYKAYLKRSRDPRVEYQPGTDSFRQYFKGYVVEPQSMPPGVNLPMTLKCQKRRGNHNIWEEGTFEILPVFKPIDIVEQVLGDAIEGYFNIQK